MPAALTVDWPSVKATAIALNSIKDAAEQHGVTYQAARVRACRESWPVGRRPAKMVALARAEAQTQLEKVSPSAVTSVTSSADAIAAALAADSNATKIGFSRAARKVAEKLPAMDAEELVTRDVAQSARHWAGVSSTVHGWDAKSGDDRRVMINIGILTE